MEVSKRSINLNECTLFKIEWLPEKVKGRQVQHVGPGAMNILQRILSREHMLQFMCPTGQNEQHQE